jgi:hypothetical protein
MGLSFQQLHKAQGPAGHDERTLAGPELTRGAGRQPLDPTDIPPEFEGHNQKCQDNFSFGVANC